MEPSQLAIVIPAYNESQSIEKVIKNVIEYGTVVVVDDCSDDETAKISLEAGAIVVSLLKNQGYDSALNYGFKKAQSIGCKYVITFDADGQHEPSCIPLFLEKLKENFAMVIGVRSKKARWSEYLFGLYSLLKYDISDPLSGMKGYCLNVYEQQGFFDSYRSIGTQLMLYVVRNDYPFIQIKIPIHSRNGPPRFGTALKANFEILRSCFFMMIRGGVE